MSRSLIFLGVALSAISTSALCNEHELHSFARQQLTDVYYSEGAAIGDINGDGKQDVVHGPYWFEGPSFKKKREIYPALAQPRKHYANNFFSWVYDFDQDGHADVMSVGLPGSPAIIYRNPGPNGLDKPWSKTTALRGVGNESPQFVNLVGDDQPELVCIQDGFFGYASPSKESPLKDWAFHRISGKAGGRFTHGLGVGDVDGDSRLDVLSKDGWYQQPASLEKDKPWAFHPFKFANKGGADMFAYDVDGDGDNDVITSLAAHAFGLAWYEQVREGNKIGFKKHLIMGDRPSQNRYGLVISELHSVNLVDIDGDGLKDIVTGKTYWSHHTGSPMWDAGAVVYWFRLVRTKEGVDWVPYKADGESGIGRQLTVGDVNGDALPDIVVGGMVGAHVLIHKKSVVNETAWRNAQPKPREDHEPSIKDGAPKTVGKHSPVDKKSGSVAGAIEGEMIKTQASSGRVRDQKMTTFKQGRWSGDRQLWWTGARPDATLSLELPPTEAGEHDIEIVMTRARDYAVVQLALDGQPLGKPIDLYHTDVVTTGVIKFPARKLNAGAHKMTVKITGANEKAVKAYMFGLDYIRIRPASGKFVTAKPSGATPTSPEGDDVLPKGADGKPLNLDFETGTLADWTATGDAFEGQPIKGDTVSPRRQDMKSEHQGDYWIGGYEKKEDGPKGTLTSSSFRVTHPWCSFLMNGGQHTETRVELVRKDTGKAFFKISGRNEENLRKIIVDLRPHSDKEIFVRIVDEHSGGWGHVNFDNFRFHKTRPGPATKPSIALRPDEYPHAGLAADAAAKAMRLPEGFSVSVSAAEPDVKQPIAMAIDDRGRVWIAEAYEYPRRAPDGKGRDRVLIFEDTNGDGKFDKRKVFTEGLNLVSGLEVGFGGVWVGAAPYLMFIPDRNGDDVPDAKPEILLDGWGYQDTHETLNAFIWGPDGWLYGCHGVFTHSKVGKPGTAADKRIPLNAGIWRYHPTRHKFEVFAHGTSNPWGVDFNDYGQAFCTACVIPHLYHIIQGARYQRQAGRHFNQYTYGDIKTIADHLHYIGKSPHGGNNKSDDAGGGHAHAGAMIYLGGAWPEQYRNQIFMNNIHGQRLNMDVLKPNGSGYVGSHGPDFLLTGDRASQILNVRYGPDGHAYMIDWYDMQACHHKGESRHDRSNGRVYKITYGKPKHIAVNLQKLDDTDLVELMLHSNDWYVRHARRVLQERTAKGTLKKQARSRLAEIALKHKDATRRLRAAWALHVTGGVEGTLAKQLSTDPNAYVRAWSVQLALEHSQQVSEETLARFAKMAREDESQVVRLYLASALQRIPFDKRWAILEALASHSEDANDHNLPLMYWYAAEPLVAIDADRALAFGLAAGESIPLLRDYMLRRIGSTGGKTSLATLVRGLGNAASPQIQRTFITAIRTALRGQRQVEPPVGWNEVYKKVAASSDAAVRMQAIALGVTFGDDNARRSMRELAANKTAKTSDRRQAIEVLLATKDKSIVELLHQLVGEATLREAALNGLALYDHPATADVILKKYAELSPVEKRIALATLCSRTPYAITLLTAVDQKKVPSGDLTTDLVRQLHYLKHADVDRLVKKVWGSIRETDTHKQKLISDYRQIVTGDTDSAPDLELGRAVFAKTCQRCHVLYGEGAKIGPDLTGSNRANLDYLLSNIVDPSAVMAKEYQPTLVVTIDGRVVSGIVRAEDDKSITLQSADATVVIPKSEIDERVLSKKSMMPDDQLKQFTKHEVRSLIAYLSGKKQVAQLATKDNAATLFNGKDLSGWSGDTKLWKVENGQIVGKSPGIRHNSFLVSDLAAENFRLTLEVKLVGNAGNSGIQFRSTPLPGGSVKGYQADIGVGWWGKLYEEHGRGLLWKKSGEEHVKSGEWNTYEIVAEGDRVRTLINGKPCVDLTDPKGRRRGILALQLHSGGPTEVRFRNLKLEVLP